MSRVSSSSFLRSLTSRTSASRRTLPSVGRAIGAAGELDPDGAVVRAPQAQQVVGDRAVGRQPLEERQRAPADRRSDSRSNGRTSVFGRLARVAEDQLEVRIGGDRRGRLGAERPDVDAFVNGFEQPRERRGALVHERDSRAGRLSARRARRQPVASASACRAGAFAPNSLSIAARMSRDRRAGREHLARAGRDVDADGALDAVLVPLDHVAVGGARLDEAVVVAAVAGALAAAEARHVAQDLRMLGGELVGRGDHFRRARRRVALERNRRQRRVLVRPELGVRGGTRHRARVGLGGLRRRFRRGRLVGSAAQRERANAHDAHDNRAGNPRVEPLRRLGRLCRGRRCVTVFFLAHSRTLYRVCRPGRLRLQSQIPCLALTWRGLRCASSGARRISAIRDDGRSSRSQRADGGASASTAA